MSKVGGRKGALDRALAGIFRAGPSTADGLLAIHRILAAHPSEDLCHLPPTAAKAFEISEDRFDQSLGLTLQHLRQLQTLLRPRSEKIQLNYLKIATAYILGNKRLVEEMVAFDLRASDLALSADAQSIKEILLGLSSVNQQSLAALRLYAALHSFSDELIKDFLEQNLTSPWTKSTLVFPFVYYFGSLPNKSMTRQMLSHFIPKSKHSEVERDIVRFLLEPDSPDIGNTAFRCYLGLLSHPYDALEYITQDLEIILAAGQPIPAAHLDCLETLAAAFSDHRLNDLLPMARGETIPFFAHQPVLATRHSRGAAADQLAIIIDAADLSKKSAPGAPAKSNLLQSLSGFRWKRYPEPGEFDEISSYRQRFATLSGTRFIDAIARSLYLFEREDPVSERLAIIRSIAAFGGVTPMTLGAPGGYMFWRSQPITLSSTQEQQRDALLSALGDDPANRDDRVWIVAANWKLAELQAIGQLTAWAKFARGAFPIWVHPRYLSGLDWYWVAQIERKVGIAVFQADPNAIYVLFLRLLEQFLRESVALRVAVEPIAREQGVEHFLDWLAERFAGASVAFVRLFLTPETILKLRLATNYTAALTTRIVFLEEGTRQFGYQASILSEEDLRQEQSSLTAALSRMSVGARQFEVPWATLKVDANARTRDIFSTHIAMTGAFSTDGTISGTKRSTTYPYANGASVEYEATNKDWSMILVIGGIVDAFLTHPSAGIESILSVRIRHDSFRREFANALATVRQSEIAGVNPSRVTTIVRDFEQTIYREVQTWLDATMHTARKDKQTALFHVIPSKAEMTSLVEGTRHLETLDEVIDYVFAWLRPALEKSLAKARESLSASLYPALERKIEEQSQRLGSPKAADDAFKVTQAVKDAVFRRAKELEEWFKVPDRDRLHSLTVGEIIQAVEQRFLPEFTSGQISFARHSSSVSDRVVSPDQIRQLYDLVSEATRNALKHSGIAKTRVKIRFHDDAAAWVSISSLRKRSAQIDKEIVGHPYKSLDEALFSEGKSGLEKMAYLSASLVRSAGSIRAIGRSRSFHLIFPLAAFGSSGSAT